MLMARMLDSKANKSQGTWGKKTFIFTDTLDGNNRLYHDLSDAEGWETGPGTRALITHRWLCYVALLIILHLSGLKPNWGKTGGRPRILATTSRKTKSFPERRAGCRR